MPWSGECSRYQTDLKCLSYRGFLESSRLMTIAFSDGRDKRIGDLARLFDYSAFPPPVNRLIFCSKHSLRNAVGITFCASYWHHTLKCQAVVSVQEHTAHASQSSSVCLLSMASSLSLFFFL